MINDRTPSPLSIVCTTWCALMLLVVLARCDASSAAAQQPVEKIEKLEPGHVGSEEEGEDGRQRESTYARAGSEALHGASGKARRGSRRKAGRGQAHEPEAASRLVRARAKPPTNRVQAPREGLNGATFPIQVDELLLAKAWVAEADLDNPTDHAAIAHALLRRAVQRGVSLDQQIHDYVSALKPNHKPTPRTRWILELDVTGSRPPSFPAHLAWDTCRGKACKSRKQLWLDAIVRAIDFSWGFLPDPCGASDWGARNIPVDVRRARKAISEGRWVNARCAGTANAFYRGAR